MVFLPSQMSLRLLTLQFEEQLLPPKTLPSPLTAVEKLLVKTGNEIKTFSYKLAFLSSSRTILSAIFSLFNLSGVTSPLILIAYPGPEMAAYSQIPQVSLAFVLTLLPHLYKDFSMALVIAISYSSANLLRYDGFFILSECLVP